MRITLTRSCWSSVYVGGNVMTRWQYNFIPVHMQRSQLDPSGFELKTQGILNFLINDNLSLFSQVYHMILATSPIIRTELTVILTSLIGQPKCQDPAEDHT